MLGQTGGAAAGGGCEEEGALEREQEGAARGRCSRSPQPPGTPFTQTAPTPQTPAAAAAPPLQQPPTLRPRCMHQALSDPRFDDFTLEDANAVLDAEAAEEDAALKRSGARAQRARQAERAAFARQQAFEPEAVRQVGWRWAA